MDLCCLVLMIWNRAAIPDSYRASPGTDQAAPRGHESICRSNSQAPAIRRIL